MKGLLLTIFLFVLSGNQEETDLPVDLKFRLLNEEGIPSTVFNRDENFVFSFLIKNLRDETVFLNQFSLNTQDFFEVFSRVKHAQNGVNQSHGKPYQHIFCNKARGIKIMPKETFKIEIPWIPSQPWTVGTPYYSTFFCGIRKPEELHPGNYWTGFTTSLEFLVGETKFHTEEETFRINFKIK